MNIIIYFQCTNIKIKRLRLKYAPAYYRNNPKLSQNERYDSHL